MAERLGPSRLQALVKRSIDVLAALGGLICLAPLLAVIAAWVRLRMGRPILFTQERAGRDSKPFHIYKFRTMTDARDAEGNLLPDADRLTRLGRLLRTTSLDELPQLWNVLCGQLSLVGPRPLPVRYLARYSPRQSLRHRVTPGITGLAQIHGRAELDWDTKLELDVQYAETYSLWLDFTILMRTLAIVVRRSGTRGGETCAEFQGAGRDVE